MDQVLRVEVGTVESEVAVVLVDARGSLVGKWVVNQFEIVVEVCTVLR